MFRRTLLAAALVTLLMPAGSLAAGAPPAPPKDAGQHVDLLPVALPIVVDGRLANYVFVHVRVNLTPRAIPNQVRTKEPHFRDALVRAAHRTPFILAGDYNKLDERRLAAALTRDATAIAGPGQVKSVTVISQQPRRRVAGPRA